MTKPLPPKQELFCEEYLKDLNATRAAIRAGYSKKTSMEQGYQLLQKPSVAKRIAQLKEERSERTKINTDWVLQRLGEEATADLKDIVTDEGSLKPVSEWPLIWRQGLIDGIDIEELYEKIGDARVNIGRVSKIKMGARIKRIELIGKHVDVQAFKEKVEVSADEGMAEMLEAARKAARKDD